MHIIPTGGALGAEVRGVDERRPLAPTEVEARYLDWLVTESTPE